MNKSGFEVLLEARWKDLFYRTHELGSAPKKSHTDSWIYKAADRLKKAADKMEGIERARKFIESECAKNPNHLPF